LIAFAAFSLRRAWQGFRANGLMSAAATATMVLMLGLLSSLLILLTGFNATLRFVEQEVQVVAYLKDAATTTEIAALQAEVSGMAQVADVVKSLPTNPLPASLQINLRNPTDYLDVANFLRGQDGVDRVLNIQQTVDQLTTVIGILRAVGAAILLVVGVIVLFVVVNTIRLAVVSRADEIEIMRLVGASDAFIRWPFIFEGAFVGLLGAFVTIAILWLGQGPITGFMSDYFKVLPVEASATVGRDVALIVLGTGLGIGVLGSWLSVRSYLKR
jgi:cell division transport system permease protein